MPTSVSINGSGNNGTISYIYDATGVKQKKIVSNGATTYYAGNYIYENSTLKFFSHPEGYIEPNGSNFDYVYQYKDHLGNVRLSYADADNNGSIDASTEIIEENNYYPFGLEHKGYNNVVNGVENNYKHYQGQEWTEDLGLNWHEWKYRMSDPAIGRFISIDPLAESFYYNSTYAFQENKLGLGTELEGAELNLHPWLVADAVKNPNGVGAHTLGVSQGLANTVTDAVDFVTTDAWKADTWKGLGNTLLGMAARDPMGAIAIDNALGTNSLGAQQALGQAIDNGVDKLVNGDGLERGEVIGEVLGAVVGTKGTTATTKAITTTIKANKTTKVFRAFGGDSGLMGKSFTPVDPNTVGNFRDAAGLPTGGIYGTNTARFMIEGTVKEKNILLRRSALPMDGNRGGLPEIVVKDATKVKIKRVSGVNPEF